MRTLITAAATAGVLAACAASGGPITDARIAQFEAGQSTVHQVVGALGQPSSDVAMADGSRLLVYVFQQRRGPARTPVHGWGGSSFSGPPTGGSSAKTKTATFRFDRRGVLVSVLH